MRSSKTLRFITLSSFSYSLSGTNKWVITEYQAAIINKYQNKFVKYSSFSLSFCFYTERAQQTVRCALCLVTAIE